MNIKKILLLAVTLVMITVFTGCVNITCMLTLNEDGDVDVVTTVLYSDQEFAYNNEDIDKIKTSFEDKGYKISDVNENGMLGFSFTKENVKLSELKNILIKEYNLDISALDDIEYKKGFLYNTYNIDSEIDLSEFLNIGKITDGAGKLITGEELQKEFSHLSLKLIVKMDKGTITDTNANLVSEDKKSAEWILIPGTASKIDFDAMTSSMLPVVGTVVILGVIVLISVILLIVFTGMYIKRRKECNDK